MAIHRQREIVMGHAAAIVGDADPAPAAAIGEDIDPAGTGVDGVFHQFLHHAGGTFHHFARGDAVDDLFGELADGHGVSSSRFTKSAGLYSGIAGGWCLNAGPHQISDMASFGLRQAEKLKPSSAGNIVACGDRVYRLEKL